MTSGTCVVKKFPEQPCSSENVYSKSHFAYITVLTYPKGRVGKTRQII